MSCRSAYVGSEIENVDRAECSLVTVDHQQPSDIGREAPGQSIQRCSNSETILDTLLGTPSSDPDICGF